MKIKYPVKNHKFYLKIFLSALLIITAGIIVYSNSLSAPFMFDDRGQIVKNFRIGPDWTLLQILTKTNRPIVDLSLALNFTQGGMDVFWYHLFNLSVHVLAALALFGVIRRSLLTDPLKGQYAQSARSVALICALIWIVHPLQTQAVTYIIQRAESMTGLFYLLTLYCVIRSAEGRQTKWWGSGAMIACALGMGSKEIMITAPISVLVYDRIFLSKSFKEIFQKRGWIHLGLAATWILLFKFITSPRLYGANAGADLKDIIPLSYALSQFGVIAHYIKLSLWPHPLCLDYAWPVAKTAVEIVPVAVTILFLFGVTLWALRSKPQLGFLGVWFFLILSPTSTFFPIADLAVEHRMYLSLAAVIVLVVLTGEWVLRRIISSDQKRTRWTRFLIIFVVGILGWQTIQRNRDYRSNISIWSTVVKQSPKNVRAHFNLGIAYHHQEEFDKAIKSFHNALAIDPQYERAHYGLGKAFLEQKNFSEARLEFEEALRMNPAYAEAHDNLGFVLMQQGDLTAAIPHFKDALRLKPFYPQAHNNLGRALAKRGEFEEAAKHFEEALRHNPDFGQAHYHLGLTYLEMADAQDIRKDTRDGLIRRVIEHFQEVLRFHPDFVEAHNHLAVIFMRQNNVKEAQYHFAEVVRLQPADAQAHNNLGVTFVKQSKQSEAARHFEQALDIDPSFARAHYNLGLVAWETGRTQDAKRHFSEALRLKPDYTAAKIRLERLNKQ